MTAEPALWIGTSWKMNKTLAEALAFADALVAAEPAADPRIRRFVMPPFTAARQVSERLAGTAVRVGAQNMHWADSGAWTGEISPVMLADCGLDMVELGHSERRMHFGETDETVALKVAAALRNGLIPLICVGESGADREAGRAEEVLARQVRAALSRVEGSRGTTPLLFAYEPVWAIGDGGTPATPDYADARHAEILAVAEGVLGRRVPCLYGGSVDRNNCARLVLEPHVDGLFVGRSAWQAEGYLEILSRCVAALDTSVHS